MYKHVFAILSVFSVVCVRGMRADLTIVENGASDYAIVIPGECPASVRAAAEELQTVIRIATGAELPLRTDGEGIEGPFFSLGATEQAAAAGLDSAGMKDEAYRILTRDGNVFIIGPDTPEGGWTKYNGVSAGTASGVYVFLEDELDTRWLMPGEMGRDVPVRESFILREVDRGGAPEFSYREMILLTSHANKEQLANINKWEACHRLGGATQFHHNHYWWQTLNDNRSGQPNTPDVRAIYEKHPEWFAMNSRGERPFPANHYAKLETTNPELVRFYADRAIERLKQSERPITYSLSPSDGGGWSQSPESKALYDPSPSGVFDPETGAGEYSMSSLVLKWYHDVAKIVQSEYPQGRLSGYIYASYVYPPQKAEMKLPDNFTPVICGIGTYGYGLYRPENRERWHWVMDEWAKVAPENWFYYDLPNQLLRQLEPQIGDYANFPGSTGIITPTATDILDIIYPQLLKSRIKGSLMYGIASWSNSAVANYLLAKLSWDPTLNARELQKEWLRRAYGARAGAVMEDLQDKLNTWLGDYYRENKRLSYKLTSEILQDVYAANYAELESMVLRARELTRTESQAWRIGLQVENLIVLQWRLRNLGMLAEDFESPLRAGDSEVEELLARDDPEFPHFPGAVNTLRGHSWYRRKALPFTVVRGDGEPGGEALREAPVGLVDPQILLFANERREVRIHTGRVLAGAYFPAYYIQDSRGRLLRKGILKRDAPVVFEAEANQAYTFTMPDLRTVEYSLLVEDAALAEGRMDGKTLTLHGPAAPVYMMFFPRTTPMGLSQAEGGVRIQKPYSGDAALSFIGDKLGDARVLQSLDMGWKFGREPEDLREGRSMLQKNFDESGLIDISVSSWWQMQGIPQLANYRGIGWYRARFHYAGEARPDERVELVFGAVDGDALVYLNGEQICEHKLGPGFKGWDEAFSRDVTDDLVEGENVLVVRVPSKSATTSSGIFKGVSLVAGKRR